jgi:hypothetical protein
MKRQTARPGAIASVSINITPKIGILTVALFDPLVQWKHWGCHLKLQEKDNHERKNAG